MSELILLLDEHGHTIGTADKVTSHNRDTPLHLAFSCYVFGTDDKVLLTMRAVSKRTWPGVWTNSFCGHPGPGETLRDAVRRRARDELGVAVTDLRLVLPQFRYRAEMSDGTVEYECCPVIAARLQDGPLRPDPSEVGDARWVTWPEALSAAKEATASPWFREQAELLDALGQPDEWPARDVTCLPEAASW